MIELNSKTPKKQLDSYLAQTVQELMNCNRCILVTGAGISCSAGIPDFRSSDGLYNLVKEKFPTTFTRGSDLFDATLFKSEEATTYFYKFMGELKDSIQQSSHTLTHQFIKLLGDKGKLLRCYTQNIDDLENDLNLNTNINDIGVQVVQMHGTLSRVVCTLSNQHNFEFDDKHIECFKEGKIPNCPSCETYEQERVKSGKRAPATGLLRPDIVLYNETHPQGEQIGSIQCNDLRKKPDLLIIMGTSLKVVGCKRLVKEMAKSIHANKKGKVIFVNLGTVSDSEWGDVIDYHFQLPTDDWVKKIMNVWGQLDRNTPKNLLMGRKSIAMSASKSSKRATLAKSKSSLSSKRQVRINVTKAIKSKPKSPRLVQSPLKFPSVKKNTDNVLKKTPAFKEFNNRLKSTSTKVAKSLSYPTFSPKKTRSYYLKQAKLESSNLRTFMSPSKSASVV